MAAPGSHRSPGEREGSSGPPEAGRPPDADTPFRALFDHALVGMGVADLQGNLLAFNDAMLRPGGYTREDIEALGNVSRLYANAEDRNRVLALVEEQGHVWREEVQFVRKDGSAYDTCLTLTPVRFAGRPCLYATVEDVTEQKRTAEERRRLEAQLLKAQKMEAVGEMTAGIAHDFNNILSVILSGCDLLALDLTSDPAEAQKHLKAVRNAAHRGAAMIRKLLGFSRTAELEVAPTDVGKLLNSMQGALESIVPQEIDLVTDVSRCGLALCDAAAVEQMVLNLVMNARDAMPDGGTLRLGVELSPGNGKPVQRPSWMPDGPFVRLLVEDTGLGMDESTRARAFEPFFTTKPQGSGTGLGLSMVFGLAKQQGGYLDLESEPGKGTRASLYFPSAGA